MQPKSLFASKLFWLGFVQAAIGILELVKVNVLEAATIGWSALVFGVVTIILRLVTRQPVTLKLPTGAGS